MIHPLARLLAPRSIAVFCGSWAERVIEQCQRIGYAGRIWPIHPSKTDVRGLPCFRSVADLPEAPDASFIAVNRGLAVEIMGELAARGAGGAVCFASGFKETGAEGAVLEAQLVAAAGNMPFLGPNCYGLINYVDRALLWPDQHGGEPVERGVAILMQSGNIACNMTMNRRGVPIAYLATLGNQAKVDLADLIDALSGTGRVTAIGVLIEGIPDVAAFAAAVTAARQRGVSVVALKSGRTPEGAALAQSHTGSLAGADAVMDAFLVRVGVARVRTLAEFLEALKLLHVHGALPGNSIVSMSCSGGEALMMADAAAAHDVRFRPFAADDVTRIRATVNPLVTIANPFDYHTFDWAKRPALQATFGEVLASGFDLGMLILDLPRQDRCDPADWHVSIDAFAAAAAKTGARGAIVSTLAESMPDTEAKALMARGLAPLIGIEEALAATAAAALLGRPITEQPPAVRISHLDLARAIALDEWQAKQALAAAGVAVPAGRLVRSEAEAVAAFAALKPKVVAKACSATLLHKTEVEGVRLGLSTPSDVAAAFAELRELANTVLIEEMVPDAVAELIVGISQDPQFGPVLTIGSGGVLVELIADVRTVLLPTSPVAIDAALNSLKVGRLLDGYRGKPAGDRPAAIAAIGAIATYAEAHADRLMELDVNPLMVRPVGLGVVAVDVLLRQIPD